MNRKLRNSVNALMLAALACAMGAMATAALPFDASVERTPGVGGDRLGLDAAAEPVARHKAGTARRMRPSAGMPYFSFVPRG